MFEDRGLGWIPDVPRADDYHPYHAEVAALLRDTMLGPHVASVGADLVPALAPPRADLRRWFPPVEHQGALQSCTASAVTALVGYFVRRSRGQHEPLSRLFVYKAARNLMGCSGDAGASLRSTLRALATFGAPAERYWPYDCARFDEEPSAFCYAVARSAEPASLTYFRIDSGATPPNQTLDNIKLFVSRGFPCVFGLPVYSEYQCPTEHGGIQMPGSATFYYGGLANVAVGYDDSIQIDQASGALLVRNAWGRSWGVEGYAWLPYRYVTERLAIDWWTVIKREWVVRSGMTRPPTERAGSELQLR